MAALTTGVAEPDGERSAEADGLRDRVDVDRLGLGAHRAPSSDLRHLAVAAEPDAGPDAELAGPQAEVRRGAIHLGARAVVTVAGWLALAVVAALALAMVVVPHLAGWVPLTILSGSMEPTIPTGSQVVVEPVRGEAATAALAPGDVVTVMPYPNDPTLVTHRVVARAVAADGTVVLTTRGDANDAADPWPLTATQVRGVVRYHIPYAGYLATALDGDQKRTGTAALAVALLGYAGIQLVRAAADRSAGRRAHDAPAGPQDVDAGHGVPTDADRTGEDDMILDPAALGTLAHDVGDDAASGFGLAYLKRLGDSCNRVARAVVAGDAEEVHVAALSLHTSASMVGAAALARHAQLVAEAGRRGDMAVADRELRRLMDLTNETQRALAEHLRVGTAGAMFAP
ncbi:signal peptidase I [Georgenia sp. M64]|uniref:signal peptidase I n=1 Tax=Georgenia sp. M64 TaxID=3120520 RepID=UPI0030DECA57